MDPVLNQVFQRVPRAKLAAELQITAQAVSLWKKVPVRRVMRVAELTGIPCHQLRPDYFPKPARQGRAA